MYTDPVLGQKMDSVNDHTLALTNSCFEYRNRAVNERKIMDLLVFRQEVTTVDANPKEGSH